MADVAIRKAAPRSVPRRALADMPYLKAVTATANALITAAELEQAAAALHGVAVRTPLLPASFLGDGIWLKPEMLQRGGAFKLRGAYNFMRKLVPGIMPRPWRSRPSCSASRPS
jgi:hypothetical protein